MQSKQKTESKQKTDAAPATDMTQEIKALTAEEAERETACVVTWMRLDSLSLLNGVAHVSDLTRWLDHLRDMPLQMGLARPNRIREDGEDRWIVSGSRADGMSRCGDDSDSTHRKIVRAARAADEWQDMFEVVVVPGAEAAVILRTEAARIAQAEADWEAEGEFLADLDGYGLLGVEAGQS